MQLREHERDAPGESRPRSAADGSTQPFPGGESWRQAVAASRGCATARPGGIGTTRAPLIGHVATRWALDRALLGIPLESLVEAPFEWREGWEYTLPDAYAP